MAHNLFIAYDLMSPGQNYDAVRDKIQSLGKYWQAQFSLYYLHTELTPEETFSAVHSVMDVNDKLAVINASGGLVTTWDQPPIQAINNIWYKP